jgi:hypothetical protein
MPRRDARSRELYRGWVSNPHDARASRDFKSLVSTNSTTPARAKWYTGSPAFVNKEGRVEGIR